MAGSQIITKGIADSAVTTAKINNSAVDANKLASDAVTTAKILADAVTGTKIRLDNNQHIRGRNAANSADINIIKVNTSDVPEFGVMPQSPFTPSAANDVANKAYVDSVAGGTQNKETFSLSAGDITNGYIDLTQVAKNSSIILFVKGLAPAIEGASYDYTVNYTGGAGSKTRITWVNEYATGGASALVASDVVQVCYEY